MRSARELARDFIGVRENPDGSVKVKLDLFGLLKRLFFGVILAIFTGFIAVIQGVGEAFTRPLGAAEEFFSSLGAAFLSVPIRFAFRTAGRDLAIHTDGPLAFVLGVVIAGASLFVVAWGVSRLV